MKFKIIPVICCVWMGCTLGMVRVQLPALKISENHCYLFTQDGNPLLLAGRHSDTPVWEIVSSDYNKTPVKPVLKGENI